MRRFISFILAILLIASLAGCTAGQKELQATDVLAYTDGQAVDLAWRTPADSELEWITFSMAKPLPGGAGDEVQTNHLEYITAPLQTSKGIAIGSTATELGAAYNGFACYVQAKDAPEEHKQTYASIPLETYLSGPDVAQSYFVHYSTCKADGKTRSDVWKDLPGGYSLPEGVETEWYYRVSFLVRDGVVADIYLVRGPVQGTASV